MDQYTKKTKIWLEQRFSAVDESGIYIAHQPIYGFHGFHCEPALIEKYIRTYQIMKTLAQLEFGSFLDAGGAEGYRAGLVRRFFGVQSRSFDLASFDFLKHEGYSVSSRRIVSPHLSLLASLLPIKNIEQGSRFPETIYRVYNAAVPLLKKLQSNWVAAALIQLDEKLCAISSRYNAALFVILKEPSASLRENKRKISAKQIVEFRVPYHEIGHRR